MLRVDNAGAEKPLAQEAKTMRYAITYRKDDVSPASSKTRTYESNVSSQEMAVALALSNELSDELLESVVDENGLCVWGTP